MDSPTDGTPMPLVTGQIALTILADRQAVLLLVDGHQRILATSDALPPYLHSPECDLVGASLLEVFPELLGFEPDLSEVVRGRSPRFDLPKINRVTPDGDDTRYVSLTALPHPEVEGCVVLLVEDVTTQGRLDQQVMQHLNEVRLLRAQLEAANDALRVANEQLARLNEEKSAFLRMAAHDLRAPLTVITGYVDMVLKEMQPAAESETTHYLGVVLRRAHQMAQLIDMLLNVEEIESGRVSIRQVSLDIGDLVRETGRSFLPVAKQKGLRMQWEVPDSISRPLADLDRIAQVLNNLVSNAIKFTPAGGRVTLRVGEGHGGITVEVSDTGPGIPEEEQAHLFQRFFRTHEARQKHIPGAGLGLSIVRAIVEQHGGRVYVQSQSGQGSTFGFFLPLPQA